MIKHIAYAFLACLLTLSFASMVSAGDMRQYDDVEKAEVIQPDFQKQKRGECPEGTLFTTDYEGTTYCRSCPEGFDYYEESKICGKCPDGYTFIPPYEKSAKVWSLGGLCVTYR